MCVTLSYKRPTIRRNIPRRRQRTANYVKFHLLRNSDHELVLLKKPVQNEYFLHLRGTWIQIWSILYIHMYITRNQTIKEVFIKSVQNQMIKWENKMYPHNREVKGTSTKICNHAKNVTSLCNREKQMALTTDFTVTLKMSQYLNIYQCNIYCPVVYWSVHRILNSWFSFWCPCSKARII